MPRAFPVRFTSEDDAARLYGVLLGVQINFPRWQGEQPWGTLRWHAGQVESHWYGLAGKPKPASVL